MLEDGGDLRLKISPYESRNDDERELTRDEKDSRLRDGRGGGGGKSRPLMGPRSRRGGSLLSKSSYGLWLIGRS